jgi:predicted DNA-binding transcriptional regulator YafY
MATILVEIKALRAMLAAIEGDEGSAWLIVDQKGERLMVKSDSGFGVLMGMTGWRERLAEAWQQATDLWRRGWNHQVVNNWGQK